MKNKFTKQEAQKWLNDYGRSWQTGNLRLLEKLFTKDAIYQETPFSRPLRGLKEIKEYWEAEDKVWTDVKFKAKRLWILDNFFFAEWECRLKRVSTKSYVAMAGSFICEVEGTMVKNLKEYWHIK